MAMTLSWTPQFTSLLCVFVVRMVKQKTVPVLMLLLPFGNRGRACPHLILQIPFCGAGQS